MRTGAISSPLPEVLPLLDRLPLLGRFLLSGNIARGVVEYARRFHGMARKKRAPLPAWNSCCRRFMGPHLFPAVRWAGAFSFLQLVYPHLKTYCMSCKSWQCTTAAAADEVPTTGLFTVRSIVYERCVYCVFVCGVERPCRFLIRDEFYIFMCHHHHCCPRLPTADCSFFFYATGRCYASDPHVA